GADKRGKAAEMMPRMMNGLSRAAAESVDEPDYYEWYFLAHALRAAQGTRVRETAEFSRMAAELRTALLERQVKTGPHSGSWEPSDRWGRAGGRVYATAMAALSLQADARASRLLTRTKTSQ
ncbi:unnamed protein product, partial [marine sediment metagenome]